MIQVWRSYPMKKERQLRLWAFEERRNLLQVFKMYKGLSSVPFSDLFTLSTVTNTRGHAAKTVKSRCQLDTRRWREDSLQGLLGCWSLETVTAKCHQLWSISSLKNGLNCIKKAMMVFFVDKPVRLALWPFQFWRLIYTAGATAPGMLYGRQ